MTIASRALRMHEERPDLANQVCAGELSVNRAEQIMNGATIGPRVYFLQAETGGPIKIGFSEVDIHFRLRQLQSWCPFRLKVLAVLIGTRRDERRLHRRFEADRVHGEWFRPSEYLLKLIEAANA